MKVWIQGISGKMGKRVEHFVEASDKFEVLGGSSSRTTPEELKKELKLADAIIDFSTIIGNQSLFTSLRELGNVPDFVLLATTGLSSDQLEAWKTLASNKGFRLLIAPNTSIGILNLYKSILHICNDLISNDFDIELIETHHRYKQDAPSGTALFLANALKESHEKLHVHTDGYSEKPRKELDLGMHAIRGGGVFGEHEVRFISDLEEVYIGHRALSRDLFAKGAIALLTWLSKKEVGTYNYEDLAIG